MSAIAGIYNVNKEPIAIDDSRGLMKALEKYPADDIKILQKNNLFLGCHAQWITPESVGEQLPFYDDERQLAITADAIIDNRDELFDMLNVERSRRQTMPDSQLILLAYCKWGEGTPKFLVGDFAFIIWDERNQKLFGARDFSGGRTLYFFQNQQSFAFCTTIKPLLTLPYVEKILNEQWIAEYIAIPGMNDTVDTSITAYKSIQQLPPSHSITVSQGKVVFSRYCNLLTDKKLKLKSNEEYLEAFREVFQSSIDARLRTRGNVGAHLSGGLDSGSVVSFAAKSLRNQSKILHTFSYVPASDFEDWTPKNKLANERPFIRSTVQHVGNISDHYLDSMNLSPLDEIDDWLEIMEMPYKFYGTSVWLKGIFQMAHDKKVGVLLNGGRGNLTISWGPAISYYATLLKKLRLVSLYRELNHYSQNIGGNRLRRIPGISRVAFPIINKFFSSEEPYQFPVFINPELAKRTNVFEKLKEHGINVNGSYVSGIFSEDIYEARRKHFGEVYPWNTTNTCGTKLSLRYSVWKRDPTNDIRVIRFCLSLPESQYVQNGLDRALIRRATENYLPDKVRLNQHFRGIQGVDCVHRMTPYWKEFIEELEDLCNDSVISELLDINMIKKIITKFKEGPKQIYSIDPHYSVLMRSLIIYRFIKKFF